jgi:hypothetical protein
MAIEISNEIIECTPQTITIRYTCALCGLIKVEVPVRVRGEEDIVTWLETVAMVAISADHRHRSPFCQSKRLDSMEVPMPPGVQTVGGPIVQ